MFNKTEGGGWESQGATKGQWCGRSPLSSEPADQREGCLPQVHPPKLLLQPGQVSSWLAGWGGEKPRAPAKAGHFRKPLITPMEACDHIPSLQASFSKQSHACIQSEEQYCLCQPVWCHGQCIRLGPRRLSCKPPLSHDADKEILSQSLMFSLTSSHGRCEDKMEENCHPEIFGGKAG